MFCPSAVWNQTGTILGDTSVIGSNPYGIFIDTGNTIYVPLSSGGLVRVWQQGTSISTSINTQGTSAQSGVFITVAGEMYISSAVTTNNIDKWTLNPLNKTDTFYIGGTCTDIFIDLNNTLYCSMSTANRVYVKSLNYNTSAAATVIGTGGGGSLSNDLNGPRGLFVAVNFSLYVADIYNHRIQRFEPGQVSATTVAGNGAPSTITLNQPAGVVLDGDGYLYIAESTNNRIVASGPNGFQCIIGCSGSSQLNGPQNLAFDSYGSIYVVEVYNARVQKFVLTTNLCSKLIHRGVLSVWRKQRGQSDRFACLDASAHVDAVFKPPTVASPLDSTASIYAFQSTDLPRDHSTAVASRTGIPLYNVATDHNTIRSLFLPRSYCSRRRCIQTIDRSEFIRFNHCDPWNSVNRSAARPFNSSGIANRYSLV